MRILVQYKVAVGKSNNTPSCSDAGSASVNKQTDANAWLVLEVPLVGVSAYPALTSIRVISCKTGPWS
jgi:hypothetical protein